MIVLEARKTYTQEVEEAERQAQEEVQQQPPEENQILFADFMTNGCKWSNTKLS